MCNYDIFLPLLLRSIARYRGFHKSLFGVLVRGTYSTFNVIGLWMQLENTEIFPGTVHVCEGGSAGRITGARDLPFLQERRRLLCREKLPTFSV